MNVEKQRDPKNNPDLSDGSAVDGHPGGGPGGFMPSEVMVATGMMGMVERN